MDKKCYIVVATFATGLPTDGTTYEVFDNERAALDLIMSKGEEFAPLSVYGGWECHEEWTEDQKDKLGFEYYTYVGNILEKSISYKIVEGTRKTEDIMLQYYIYSKELNMYVGNDNKLTENEGEALLYDNIGEAMDCAARAMNSGNIFHVYSIVKGGNDHAATLST